MTIRVDRWMEECLSGDCHLRQITMPGSHDAGIYPEDMRSSRMVPLSLSQTQDLNIAEQCHAGSRFFDLRFKEEHSEVLAYHQKAGFGAVGGEAGKIFQQIDAFLSTHRGEFVILRFSHTKPSTGITELLTRSPLGRKLYKGLVNLAHVKVQQLRGKVICVFDERNFKNLDQKEGLHPFSKWAGQEIINGLVTCGKFANSSDFSKVIDSQIREVAKHSDHIQNHLFVLYWTQTGGNIQKNTMDGRDTALDQRYPVRGGVHHNVERLRSFLMKQDGEYYSSKLEVQATTHADRLKYMPNVVMYDFVNPRVSSRIVALNDRGVQGHLAPANEEA